MVSGQPCVGKSWASRHYVTQDRPAGEPSLIMLYQLIPKLRLLSIGDARLVCELVSCRSAVRRFMYMLPQLLRLVRPLKPVSLQQLYKVSVSRSIRRYRPFFNKLMGTGYSMQTFMICQRYQ